MSRQSPWERLNPIKLPDHWSEVIARVQEQARRRREELNARVQLALLCPFFGGTDDSLPKLTTDQACQIAEAFAAEEHIKCEFLLKEVGL